MATDNANPPRRRARGARPLHVPERSPRGERYRIIHVAQIFVAVLAIAGPPALLPDETWRAVGTAASLEVAKNSGASRSRLDKDIDADIDTPRGNSPSSGPRLRGLKSPTGGYSPERVQHFWRHYHGARHERKPTPLEHEK